MDHAGLTRAEKLLSGAKEIIHASLAALDEEEQKQREQWGVDDQGRRFPQSHGDEVGDDGRRKDDRQPAVDLPNPVIPIQ